MYRIKFMNDQEWADFQRRFVSICKIVLNSGGRTAVFIEANVNSARRAVLIPKQLSAKLEALIPGGWQNCSDAMGRPWMLLAGTSGAFAAFGVPECPGVAVSETKPADILDYPHGLHFSSSLPRDEFRVN